MFYMNFLRKTQQNNNKERKRGFNVKVFKTLFLTGIVVMMGIGIAGCGKGKEETKEVSVDISIILPMRRRC